MYFDKCFKCNGTYSKWVRVQWPPLYTARPLVRTSTKSPLSTLYGRAPNVEIKNCCSQWLELVPIKLRVRRVIIEQRRAAYWFLLLRRIYVAFVAHWIALSLHKLKSYIIEVSTGPGRMRAGPGRARADFLNCGPGLTWPGRAERFYNLLGIRAGFLQSFTRTNFLTNGMFYMFEKQFENFLNFL